MGRIQSGGGAKPFEFVRTSEESKGPFALEAPSELMASTHYESFLGGGSCGQSILAPICSLLAALFHKF